MDLNLLQKQVANQIGVHVMTIIGWESNATVPEVRYVPAIIQFLGYNPLPVASSLPERLAAARRALGLSQQKMAAKLGVDPATLMGWEAGRHHPNGKSLDLIGRRTEWRSIGGERVLCWPGATMAHGAGQSIFAHYDVVFPDGYPFPVTRILESAQKPVSMSD